MSVFGFCRLLHSRWRCLARVLWPDTLLEQLQAKLERLDGELARSHQRLLKCRQQIEKIRLDLQRRERRLTLLSFEVHNETGIPPVEKLACRGRAIDRLRERLQARERAYAERLARFRRCKQQRDTVRTQLLCCPPSHRTGGEEENDLGYPF